jgi:tetratricopeptide (TPR) repeat protein
MAARLPARLTALFKRRDVVLGVPALAALLIALTVFIYYPAWRASRHWRNGERAAAAGDFTAAAEHFKKYVAAYPHRAEGLFVLARTLRRAGRFDESRTVLARARRLDWVPEQVELEETLLEVQQGLGQPRDIDRLAALVRAEHPDEPLILEALVQGLRQSLRLDEAGAWLDHWVERFPDDAAARRARAEHRQAFGHFDQAQADYRKLLELRPHHDEAYLRLGQLALANRSQIAEAEANFRKFLDRHPDHAEALLGLARCLREQGDFDGAADLVKQVIELRPEHSEAALLAGTLENDRGRFAAALPYLGDAERAGADPQATQFQLALAHRRLGNDKEAQAHEGRFQHLEDAKQNLDKAVLALLADPKNPDRHIEVARWFVEMGQDAKAEGYLLAGLRLEPDHRASHLALADFYDRTNQPDRAERHRRLAKQPAP